MFVRLAMNLSMTVIPFYLIHVLDVRDPNEHPDKGIPTIIALVPLVSFIMSTIFSLFVYNRLVNHFGNRLIPLFIGCCVISIGSAPFLFLQPSFRWLVFICASSQGMGLAILLNTSTSIISDVIGNDDTSSAFVYGTYSLFDKFSSGILLTIISVSYFCSNISGVFNREPRLAESFGESLAYWILFLSSSFVLDWTEDVRE